MNFISKCCQVVADTGWSNSIFSDRKKYFIKCIQLMFLESLYIYAGLGVWIGCFQRVKWSEFRLLELFWYIIFAAPCNAWTSKYILRRTNNRHQQTPFQVNMNCNTSSNILFGCLGTSVDVVCCLLEFLVALNCPAIPGKGVWEHISAVWLWVSYASQGV